MRTGFPETHCALPRLSAISGRAVDPRFGGDAALREFIETAHSRGIRVLLDLINNQVHETHEYVEAHPEWFRTDCVCGLSPGCGWSERPFECLFAPYLPDIDWTHPGAQAQFIDDAVFWVEEYGWMDFAWMRSTC